MRISVRVANTETVVRNLQKKEAEAIVQAQEAVAQASQEVLTDTQAIMPVVTGALRDSGKTAIEVEGQRIVGYIGFGDSSRNPNSGKTTASYAVEKHEASERGKWLENTVYDHADIFMEDLAKALQKAF